MNKRDLTQEEQRDVLNVLAVVTGFLATFCTDSRDDTTYDALMAMCKWSTGLMLELEPDEKRAKELRKGLKILQDKCDCSKCRAIVSPPDVTLN